MHLPAPIRNSCNAVSTAIDHVNEWIGRAVAWLTAVLVVLIGYDVVSRYCFNTTYVAVQELQWHLFAIIFLVGAGYTLRHDKHVRVDIFYAHWSPRWQAVVNLAGAVLFLLPFTLVGLWASWPYMMKSLHPPGGLGPESSPSPGGLPYRWVLKAMIVACFAVLVIQGIALVCRSIVNIVEPPPREPEHAVEEGL